MSTARGRQRDNCAGRAFNKSPLAIHARCGDESVPVRILFRSHTRMPLLSGADPALRFQDLGPLLDRIDIHIEVPAVKYKELQGNSEVESSAAVRARVLRARQIQLERYRSEKGLREFANAVAIASQTLRDHGRWRKVLETAIQRLGLSARAHDRVLKVPGTIADLEGRESIESKHLSKAIQYRTLDRTYWA